MTRSEITAKCLAKLPQFHRMTEDQCKDISRRITSYDFVSEHFCDYVRFLRECGLFKMPKGVDSKMWWCAYCICSNIV